MPELTAQDLLNSLQDGWGTYVQRFRRLSTDEQVAFLRQQGYTRLGDLLGHVIAWWQEALAAVPRMAADPGYQTPDYDVDEFNARAVEKYHQVDEETILKEFEAARRAWEGLIGRLPEHTLQDPHLRGRLHIELIGHLEEHQIKDKG